MEKRRSNKMAAKKGKGSDSWGLGTKIMAGGTIAALLTGWGAYTVVRRVSTRIWNFIYPPSFSKYVAVGVLLGSALVVKNMGAVSHEIGRLYNGAGTAIERYIEGKETLNKLSDELNDLFKENKSLEERISYMDQLIKDSSKSGLLTRSYGPVQKQMLSEKIDPSASANPRKAPVSQKGGELADKPLTITRLEPRLLAEGCGFVLYYNKQHNQGTLYACDASSLIQIKNYRGTSGINANPKSVQNDKATPEGVYNIDGYKIMPGLPPLYGSGMAHIDYPNADDKRQGRLGGGIVISGTSFSNRIDAMARGLNSTNGGITFCNYDFQDFVSYTTKSQKKTVVVIENPSRPLKIME